MNRIALAVPLAIVSLSLLPEAGTANITLEGERLGAEAEVATGAALPVSPERFSPPPQKSAAPKRWKVRRLGKPLPPLPEGSSPPARALRVFLAEASAYTPGPESCGESSDGVTATGHKAVRGVIAVDPNVIPLGSLLYVEGYGYGWALDVGSAIKGNRVDLLYETVDEALAWGRRTVRVYLVE